jgi:small conductance mechanosensitive channel
MMNKISTSIRFAFLALVLLGLTCTSANAFPVPQTAQPEKSSTIHLIDSAIGQQIQALVTNGETTDIEPQETFGTRVFGVILGVIDLVRSDSVGILDSFSALPQTGAWFAQQYEDPTIAARWASIGHILFVALIGGFVSSLILQFLLAVPRKHLARRNYASTTGKVAAALAHLGLCLLPILLFIGAALISMNQSDPPRLSRFVTMSVLYAIVLHQIVRLVAHFVFSAKIPHLRLTAMGDEMARFFQKWVDRLAPVMIYGFFAVDIARLMRVPQAAIHAFSNTIGFVIVVMVVTMIYQKRNVVASLLRGDLTAHTPNMTSGQSLRLWLARTWHRLAAGYMVAGYLYTVLTAGSRFSSLLQGTILTLVILIVMRLLIHAIAQVGANATSHFYRPVLRGLLRLVVWVAAALCVLAAWGIDIIALIETPWGQRIAGSALSIASTILIATLIYETINAAIERKLHPRDKNGVAFPVSARALTLLPLMRNTALVVLTGIVILAALSEFGVNIAPLLAGAGVIGVAIGFGSQSLVKDFITGLFILMENAIAVGDVVAIGDNSGVVESMTIRTIRIRATNGDLHIVPFGEVARLTNKTKGFSFALIEVGVAYDSDMNKVMRVLNEIAENLRNDAKLGTYILEPLEMFGLDKLGDCSLIVSCRLKTLPGRQWDVRRAFNLEIKNRFEAEGIEIPFPTVTNFHKGTTPASA